MIPTYSYGTEWSLVWCGAVLKTIAPPPPPRRITMMCEVKLPHYDCALCVVSSLLADDHSAAAVTVDVAVDDDDVG